MSRTGWRYGCSFSRQTYGNQLAKRTASTPGRCRTLNGSRMYPTSEPAASICPSQVEPDRCEPVTRIGVSLGIGKRLHDGHQASEMDLRLMGRAGFFSRTADAMAGVPGDNCDPTVRPTLRGEVRGIVEEEHVP